MVNSQEIAESGCSTTKQNVGSRPNANSQVCKKLISLTDDAYCTIKLYQGIFIHEPALTAWVLRIANSQRLKTPILTISEAISFLGWKKIRGIVSAICLSNISSQANPVMELVWRQCCLRTLLCRIIAAANSEETKLKLEQLCYVLSIGKIQMAAVEPEKYAEVLNLVKAGCNFNEAEHTKFGYIGYSLSAELCQTWQLPDYFSEIVSDYALGKSKDEAHRVLALGELISIAATYTATEELETKLNIENIDKILAKAQRELEYIKKISGF